MVLWFDLVCGPSPIEGLSNAWSDGANGATRIWWVVAAILLIVCTVLLALATGWWALLAVPAYLVSVAATTLVTARSALHLPVRLLIAIGLPTLSMFIVVGTFKLFGLL